ALARKASKITLYDIVAVIDGVDQLDHCVVGMAQCDDKQPCPQHDEWKPIRNQLKTYLMQTTLEKMADTLKEKLTVAGEKLPELQSKSKPVRIP
ncbi:MAG: Rrf2 family transcriptional regulator, partial [Rhodospirillales bacterium]|nr:Rrf2 family transcriptional regulator [Rhodospirillales bacterium]